MTNVATIRYDEDSQRYGDGGIKKCATSSQVLVQMPFMIFFSFGSNTSCCLDRTGLQGGTTYEGVVWIICVGSWTFCRNLDYLASLLGQSDRSTFEVHL
jgi:hypothetical protein